LILGVAGQVGQMPDVYATSPYLAAVEREGRLTLAALMTPPHNLLLATPGEMTDEDFQQVAESLIAGGWQLSGITAERDNAQKAARLWEAGTGAGYEVHTRLRLYELRVVTPPAPASGRMRIAVKEDVRLLQDWCVAFQKEAVGSGGELDKIRMVAERRTLRGDVFLWEDECPVSMAVRTRRSLHGAVIGGVYTPPELRGQGYASACVAGMSQALLDAGDHFCALYTDLTNPTSNHIYQQIGYRPVNDWLDVQFVTWNKPAG
jgi:predicted GNAT family acetyltransferase